MKNILFLSILTFAMLKFAPASPTAPTPIYVPVQIDTNKYLQENFKSKKERFVHKPLNEILDQLNIKVKSYQLIWGKLPGSPREGVVLSFDGFVEMTHKQSNFHQISIRFENVFPTNTATALMIKNDFTWTLEEKEYYGPMIVKDTY